MKEDKEMWGTEGGRGGGSERCINVRVMKALICAVVRKSEVLPATQEDEKLEPVMSMLNSQLMTPIALPLILYTLTPKTKSTSKIVKLMKKKTSAKRLGAATLWEKRSNQQNIAIELF